MSTSEVDDTPSRGVPRDLALLCGASAALAALGWFIFALSYRHTHAIDIGGLFPGGPVYLDLTVYLRRWEVIHTAQFFQPSPIRSTFAYPPAAALCYGLLYGTHHIKFAYNVLTGVWLLTLLSAAAVSLWRRKLSTRAVSALLVVLALLSFPAVFLFERANIEIFVWMCLLAGGVLYRQGRLHSAAVSIGLATAIKLYPLLLFGLFFSRKREWKAVLSGVLSAMLATGVAIWYAGPTFPVALHGFVGGFSNFQGSYANGGWLGLLRFDHSLFSPLKLLALSVGHSPASWNLPYYVCAALVSAALFLRVRRYSLENRLTFLFVLVVFLPAVSFEYTLVQILFPAFCLILFLLDDCDAKHPQRGSAILALGGLCFALMPSNLLGVHAGQWQVLGLLLAAGQATLRDWRPSEAESLPRL